MEEQLMERYNLISKRIKEITREKSVPEKFRPFFSGTASFLTYMNQLVKVIQERDWSQMSLQELQQENHNLYEDILPENYKTSFANPSFATSQLGDDWGFILSALYTELRGIIPYVFEGNTYYLTILQELFVEIYTIFEEGEPDFFQVQKSLYWYASDYCDVFVADRILEQLNSKKSFVAQIVQENNWKDERSLYRYGEYISTNELETLRYLNSLPEEELQRMADVYTEGYRLGFAVARKSLKKKATVEIRFSAGFEPVIQLAIHNFKKMGLAPAIYRNAISILTRNPLHKNGFLGGSANKQYEYDHRQDQGLILDKQYLERKYEVMWHTYEQQKELAAAFAGPACMEVFGEKPFVPQKNRTTIELSKQQEKLYLQHQSKTSQMVNQYIKGEERSYTLIAYPVPEIGEQFEEIFSQVIKINTLDYQLYQKVQQIMIDALDLGESVHVVGAGTNQTDLTIRLKKLADAEKETKFENCVADMNIPVGEVFTSPVLEGTNGVLHVSKVYLNELQYQNLRLEFQDGMIVSYHCTNFDSEEENDRYIYENILHNHESLPMGEFAIGTNTTAYMVAKRYQIEDKLPILIAEKMGPHFAVGDTCYSWEEDNHIYNPDGKEIVAKENQISRLRTQDPQKAYFQCHTDITIPYEELEELSVSRSDGSSIPIISKGKFVLPGTEVLNEPLTALDGMSKMS